MKQMNSHDDLAMIIALLRLMLYSTAASAIEVQLFWKWYKTEI